jgi:hypothetical protein
MVQEGESMAQTMTMAGTLHGNVITLDTIEPAPKEAPEKGQRVLVALEPLDEADLVLSPAQQAQLLRAWAEHGPQGPIEDEGEA